MFYDIFVQLCAEKGVSPSAAAEAVGLNRSAVVKWKRGGQVGSGPLQRLADYFGVTTDYLLGAETEKAPAGDGKRAIRDDELMFALWGDAENISEDDLEDVRRYAAFLRERKGKK